MQLPCFLVQGLCRVCDAISSCIWRLSCSCICRAAGLLPAGPGRVCSGTSCMLKLCRFWKRGTELQETASKRLEIYYRRGGETGAMPKVDQKFLGKRLFNRFRPAPSNNKCRVPLKLFSIRMSSCPLMPALPPIVNFLDNLEFVYTSPETATYSSLPTFSINHQRLSFYSLWLWLQVPNGDLNHLQKRPMV